MKMKMFMKLRAFLPLFILLLSCPCKADTDTADSLMRFAGNIHQFNAAFPQEKVWLQFDNTSYYTGETIWFKAFVVNAFNLGRAGSKVLYVDLISPTGVLLQQEKLKIIGGQADGSLSLVDAATSQAREKRGMMNYPSGFYEVRAYTSFMQNFSEEAIFSRVIAVYEKPEHDGEYYEYSPVIKLMKADLAETRPKAESLKRINVSFHPEGGHLIIGKPCRVAFKVTGPDGMGIDADGTLEGADLNFSTVHDGMGEFTFTPTDRQNSVEISSDGITRSFSLPQAELSGCALNVSQTDSDSLRIRILPSPDFYGATLGLTITCRGEVMDFQKLDLSPDGTVLDLSMYGIPEGVCNLCVFDRNGTVYASRHFYHRSRTSDTPVLTVTPDRKSYAPFERINLQLDLKDAKGLPLRDRFCLSVRDARGQESVLAGDLRTDFLLSSDLKGYIENPSWYFESADSIRNNALDLLTLIQGWERYDWQTMTGCVDFTETHRLEKQLTLNGWVLNPAGNKPLKDVEVLAAMMPTDKSLSETYTYHTDSSGYFGFDIGAEFYGKARFSIDTRVKRERRIGSSARLRLDRSMLPSIRQYQPQELVFTPTDGTPTSVRKESQQVDDGRPEVINKETGYILPDVDVVEERMYIDYFTFNSFNVAKDVEVDLDNGEYTTDLLGYLLDKGYQVLVGENGSIESVNGFEPFFYVHNTQKIRNTGIMEAPASIDTKDIVSIIVFDRPMYMMNILVQCPLYQDYLNHTLSVITGEALYQRKILIDVLVKEEHQLSTRKELYKINKRLTTVDGYSAPYSFYSPQYPDGPIAGDVDYRRTLYWEPNVVTDSLGHAEINLYNSSITTHINVSAAGITSSGNPYVYDRDF